MLFHYHDNTWQRVARFPGHIDRHSALVLVRVHSEGGSGGVGKPAPPPRLGLQDVFHIRPLTLGTSSGSYINTDPLIRITSPHDGETLDISDRRHMGKQFQNYRFAPGDTVAQVSQQLTGYVNPSAVFDYPLPGGVIYSPRRPPTAGDNVNICTGDTLRVHLTAQNSDSVWLQWRGSNGLHGQHHCELPAAPTNAYQYRETRVGPITPGTYTLTASVVGAHPHTITVTVVGHTLAVTYHDKDDTPLEKVPYQIDFQGRQQRTGTLTKGKAHFDNVPNQGFTLTFIPEHDTLEQALMTLRQSLNSELKTALAAVQQDTASYQQTWSTLTAWEKPIIYLGSALTGIGQWIGDTVMGVVDVVSGLSHAQRLTQQWLLDYAQHRARAVQAFAVGDEDGFEHAMQHIQQMHHELGEDLTHMAEAMRTLGLLLWDDDTRQMLMDFPQDYFAALHPTEKVRVSTRYGIDVLLVLAVGLGAGLLAIKNAAKIAQLLKRMTSIIEKLRLHLVARKPKVDTTYDFKVENKKTTLSPPNTNPHPGLHNRDDLTPRVKDGSFTTQRQVDMDNLSEEDDWAKESLLDQGWNDRKIKQVLESGHQFQAKSFQQGDRLYGFNSAGRARDVKNSAYLLDEAGYQEIKEKYYREGHWDKEGVKDYLALPCFNAASQVDEIVVTDATTGVQSRIGAASELLQYQRLDGSTTGMVEKAMSGGGQQVTVNPRHLQLLVKE